MSDESPYEVVDAPVKDLLLHPQSFLQVLLSVYAKFDNPNGIHIHSYIKIQ